MNGNEKSDRLVEAASAVLNAAPDHRLNAVVLNKALFYLDLATLRDRGTTITENTYIALKNGPVVAKYQERLIGKLEKCGIGKQISEGERSKPILLESSPQNFRFIDSETLILVSAVTSFFARLTSRQASKYSHENPGWKLAWNESRRIGRPTAINMRVALQQIIDVDPWMELPLLNDEELLAVADSGVGVDW